MRTWLGRHWRILVGGIVLAVIVALVIGERAQLVEAWFVLRRAHLSWIVAAIITQSVVYLCFSSIYWRSLQILGQRVRLLSLYWVSFVAIMVGRAFPAGGTSIYAFLLYQLRRRGVPDGTGAVTMALDGLAYFVAFAVLLLGGFIYLFTHDRLPVRNVQIIAVVILAIIILGMYVWGLSRDRALLTRRALAIKNRISRLFRAQWSDTPVLAFLAEVYEGGALVQREPWGFVQLVGLHITALLIDCVSILFLFYAVGYQPHFSGVVLGYTLAYLVSTVTSLPGGGGAFELTMAKTMGTLDIPESYGLSVALLYRVITLWLPLVISALIFRRLQNYGAVVPPSTQRNPHDRPGAVEH